MHVPRQATDTSGDPASKLKPSVSRPSQGLLQRPAQSFDPKIANTAKGPGGDALVEFPAESDGQTESAPAAAANGRDSRGTRRSRAWLAPVLAMAFVVVVAAGIFLATFLNRQTATAGAAQEIATGQLRVQTRPDGVEVFVDGERRGTTPLALAVAPGAHTVTIRNGTDERTVPVSIAAGSQVEQYFDMQLATGAPLKGRLSVVTDPPGARVFVDGRARGISPVVIDALTEAQHRVRIVSDGVSHERTVTVTGGSVASVVFSLSKASGPVGGWVAVDAPFDVQIVEDQEVLGTGATRIMLAAGRHDLVLMNQSIGYREQRTVSVTAGKTTEIRVDPPKVPVSLNARPWAEITLDGASVGQTPIANLLVPVGSHEVIFSHPQYAEVRQTVLVTTKGPNRIAADLTK